MSDFNNNSQNGNAELSDEALMRFTQGKRFEFINHLTEKGMPDDPKDRHFFLTTMADMDRTALGNKRIGAQEKVAAADALAAQAFVRMTTMFGNRNPYEVTGDGSGRALPAFDSTRIRIAEPVPGETDIGIINDDFESIMSRADAEPDSEDDS